MPYKSEKIRLSPSQDRRRKLTDEQKQQIKELYATGLYSQRALAREFNVNRSTIAIIVNPERAKAVSERRKEHANDYKYDKETWAKVKREHRHYKQSLYLKGELKEEES